MDKAIRSPIAIVGFSGVFPQALGNIDFWNNIVQKVDAAVLSPSDRWIAPAEWVYDKHPQPDRAYARQACLIQGYEFKSEGFNIHSTFLDGLDPLFHWVLDASQNALGQTHVGTLDKSRMGVVLAAIALPTEVSSALARALLLHPLFRKNPDSHAKAPRYGSAIPSGRVVGMPAAVVARALGLGGCSYTLDAACASSLYAVKLACDELQSHRADAMLAGGVSRPDPLYTQIGFSQLRALSPSGRCAPFDETADGLVVGEGAGVMVLKRLPDALFHGDTIFGVIRGIGVSNDMRGNLLAPESAGQLRAMRMAYIRSGWQPWDVDYIECHGAGTPVGDATELQSLRALWGETGWREGQCAIGSIKSMIGHLLTGAGAAGMIKMLLALSKKTLPPSLKFSRPKKDSPLLDGPFRVQTDAEPWHRREVRTTRKAAVSAFGFGGINAHVLIEEWPEDRGQGTESPAAAISGKSPAAPLSTEGIAIVGVDLTLGPLNSVAEFQKAVFNAEEVLSPAPEHRWKSARTAQLALEQSTPRGAFVENIDIAMGEFHIPPGELPDILPQQLLMLKTAAGAMKDAGLPLRQARERMGAIIGISFDFEATNFHLRWALPHIAAQWSVSSGRDIDEDALERWLNAAKDQCGPPLTATRTLGALGGIVASRIAREFQFGGPSFVVSAEEASGLRAVEIGMHMLQSGELDAVLVGAVDLNCDERNLATLKPLLQFSPGGQVRPFDRKADGTLPGEGAVALVLKRVGDAIASNDRIYAVVKGTGSAAGDARAGTPFSATADSYCASMQKAFQSAGLTPDQIQLAETHGSGIPVQDKVEARALHDFLDHCAHDRDNAIAIGTLKPIIGHTGAVSGLASMAKSAICLYQRMLAPAAGFEAPLQDLWDRGYFHLPTKAAYWAHDRADGPRGAMVAAMTADGGCMHAILQESTAGRRRASSDQRRRQQPAGPLPCALFVVGGTDRRHLLDQLERLAAAARSCPLPDGGAPAIARLASQWHNSSKPMDSVRKLAIVARSVDSLLSSISEAGRAVASRSTRTVKGSGGVSYFEDAASGNTRMAFVFPGSGNHYIGMGRTLGLHFPDVLRTMEESTDHFRAQMLPRWYDPWRVDWRPGWQRKAYDALVADALRPIFGQVLFGGQMTGVLKQFKLSPDAVIGYSLGESAGLFAMGAWPDRGEMLARLSSTNLFKTELSGPCNALRRAWHLPADQPVQWVVAAVNREAASVDRAIAGMAHVRRLIVNTASQCVIGGLAPQVEAAINEMACEAVYLDGVVTVHCDAALPAAEAYEDLHRFDTTPVAGVDFYSCADEKILDLTAESAAASITRQAVAGFNFPATIEQAYADGVRIFVEVGPHCSCTHMIDDILGDREHLAVAANHRGEDECLTLLKCLGTLAAAGLEMDLDPLYAPFEETSGDSAAHSRNTIRIKVGSGPLVLTPPALGPAADEPNHPPAAIPDSGPGKVDPGAAPIESAASGPGPPDYESLFEQMQKNIESTGRAHEKFLELTREITAQYAEAFALQNELIAAMAGDGIDMPQPPAPQGDQSADGSRDSEVAFNRRQCMEFAIGSVGRMLGPEYEIIDTYKARVRLPDEPLMLVDRIIRVEGEKCSLGSGRVVTEHDVLAGAWYLDGDRAPVCISVEAGQADLFLCAYLGIDHQVKGERTYRLLDARIRFHRGLPRPGETIRYDIHIDKFVRQEETYLFFFRYEGFIGSDHLITMTQGCAGFFTDAEVRHSGGIILTEEDRAPGAAIGGTPYAPLLPVTAESYDDGRVEALRQGDAAGCFGPDFSGIRLPGPLRLPGGRMRLLNRILSLDPAGGRFAKGYVEAEADISPEDWFLTCHFVDDRVMPGTLMYECCAHTLRVFLLRMGWITDKADVAYEPVQGPDCRLKCRGPVTPETRHVRYAVEIKEMGYHPEPYVIADAHMFADDHYIVFFKDMSMQITGVTRSDIENFWRMRAAEAPPSSVYAPMPAEPLFTREHILEFAVGRPSQAFGAPYAPFDTDRRIARLPGPPYCFMDRITAIEPEPWVLKADGWVTAEYDIPPDAWYFAADRSGVMPFAVLLEIALQPCGWLAAFAGSALKSENDLKFRNLGGTAVVHHNISPQDGTLTMRTRITKVSEAGDMIIENFDFEVSARETLIYTGNTYFGFFTARALAQQVGLRESVYMPSDPERALEKRSAFEATAPILPDDAASSGVFRPKGLWMPSKALCMVDGIDIHIQDGGPHGLGFIRGYKKVDPGEWFFKAHFYQDPVCPGSLGIESFLQLVKYAALQRWPHLKETHRFETVCEARHQWSYRGQVIPANKLVLVDAVITRIEEGPEPVIMADGCLQVDGIYIYKMEGFGLRLVQ